MIVWPKKIARWRRHVHLLRFDQTWSQEFKRLQEENLTDKKKTQIIRNFHEAVQYLSDDTVDLPNDIEHKTPPNWDTHE